METRLLEITIDEEGMPNIYLNKIKVGGARQNYAWCMVDKYKCFWEEVIKMFWYPTQAQTDEDRTEARERILPLKEFLEETEDYKLDLRLTKIKTKQTEQKAQSMVGNFWKNLAKEQEKINNSRVNFYTDILVKTIESLAKCFGPELVIRVCKALEKDLQNWIDKGKDTPGTE